MRIALLSYAYQPSLGGIESVSRLVADGLADRGHDVTVITMTPGASEDESRVLRRPSPRELVRALRSADAVVQSNVSLALAWPLLARIVRRKWVVVNHTPIARTDGRRTLRDRLKIVTLPRNTYSVSRFLQGQTPVPTRVMPNPYDDRVFRTEQDRESYDPAHLLFVGRLAPVKGLDILLEALATLATESESWRLTVVGDGPDRIHFEQLTEQLGLTSRVDFVGRQAGAVLARTMSLHRIVVMPSRRHPAEAFPLVPLEAIASGCVVVASAVGGLPEAVGLRGIVTTPEDVPALVATIRGLVSDRLKLERLAAAKSPAGGHTISAVAVAYERALEDQYQ